MSFQCYSSRTSLRSTMIGGLFISSDGTRRFLPDRLLNQAELFQGSCLIRLNYSFCTIEVSGKCLESIFEDICTGKLGAVQAVPFQAPQADRVWVTSIVVIASPRSPLSASEREHSVA